MKSPESELPGRRLSREVNERISVLNRQFALDASGDLPVIVFCECGREDCMTPVEMTLSEYEAVRKGSDRWVVSSAHIGDAADSILARRNGYALVRDAPDRLSTEAEAPRKESSSPPTATEFSRH